MVRSQEAPPLSMPSLSIGKLADAAGVGVETVRFYQRRGLLRTPSRDGGTRRYDAEDVRRLRFVRQAQAAGFTLEEIGTLMALDAQDDRDRVHAMAEARIAALDHRIAELTRARQSLALLAGRCASGQDGSCPILAAFDG